MRGRDFSSHRKPIRWNFWCFHWCASKNKVSQIVDFVAIPMQWYRGMLTVENEKRPFRNICMHTHTYATPPHPTPTPTPQKNTDTAAISNVNFTNKTISIYIYTSTNINGSDHYNDVIMGAIASLISSLTIVYSTVYSDADQRKHQSSASLAFVRGIHWAPVNSPHKWPVTRKCFHLMTSSCSVECE